MQEIRLNFFYVKFGLLTKQKQGLFNLKLKEYEPAFFFNFIYID